MDPTTQRLMSSASSNRGQTFLVATHSTSPYVTAYPFGATGLGTKYADPSTLPAGTRYGVDISSDYSPKCVALCGTGSPIIDVYKWTGNGFGSKYSNPSLGGTVFGAGRGIRFLGQGGSKDYAIAMVTDSPDIAVYAWDFDTGFGTRYTSPAALPSFGYDIGWNGSDIFFAHAGSPYITAYPFTQGGGFGSKYADPASLASGTGFGVATAFNNPVFLATSGSPYIHAWNWSSGFGTKWSNPATLPTGDGRGIALGTNLVTPGYVAIAHATSPYISVYPYFSTFGTKVANPATLPTGQGNAVDFCDSFETAIAVGHETSPYISVYPYFSIFGTKYSNPATLPPAGVTGVRFSTRNSSTN